MSEMIERVARAIQAAHGDGAREEIFGANIAAARAALEAMREPTDNVVDAIMPLGMSDEWKAEQRIMIRRDIAKMIDAALKDPAQ